MGIIRWDKPALSLTPKNVASARIGLIRNPSLADRRASAQQHCHHDLPPWKDSHEKPVIYHCISRMNEAEVLAAMKREEEWRLKVTATCRVRYFTDGAVIGSAKAAAGTLWSVRDLQVGIG